MRLRVVDGRVQVGGRELVGDGALVDALREWARVAEAVLRDGDASGRAVVSSRGRQLVRRLAAAHGEAVDYLDPVTGEASEMAPPEPVPTAVEPVPWATGLTASGFVAAVVVVADFVLSVGLAESLGAFAIGVNLLVGAGLGPAVWLTRRTPVWRWAALGVAVGLVLSWVALLLGALL